MESDILRQHSLALSPWLPLNPTNQIINHVGSNSHPFIYLFILLQAFLLNLDSHWYMWDFECTCRYSSLLYTKGVQKISRLKLYLLKQEWTMNEMLIFFKIGPLALNPHIPAIEKDAFESPLTTVANFTYLLL